MSGEKDGFTLLGLVSLVASALVACSVAPDHEPDREPLEVTLELIGQAEIEYGYRFQDSIVGGLSGIAYIGDDRYLTVSDDRGIHGPQRVYRLHVDLSDGRLAKDGVVLEGWFPLVQADGSALESGQDPEGIAVAGDSIYVSTEGTGEMPVIIARFDADGRQLARLHLAPRYDRRPGAEWGPRDNLAFEGLAVVADGTLFVGLEGPLRQDGDVSTLDESSAVRIMHLDAETGATVAEYLYEVDPIHAPPLMPGGFKGSGLTELTVLDRRHLLVLERSFALGAGFSVRLYLVSLDGATDVSGIERLSNGQEISPLSKTLLLDIDDLDVAVDNLEGMTLGPVLPDGRRALLLVSDNNFFDRQVTQFLAFALDAR